ncbi:MAG: hypothetical protein FGM37_00310 [Phycisphaerales bacterium]|nr:hypothetical protein [Phycisphaerales bacterium]
MILHAPGAADVLPRLTAWAVARAAVAEGAAWSGEGDGAGQGSAPCASADVCWRASLADWASVTRLAPAARRGPAWIGPSVKLSGGGSTVPPLPHMLHDALASWHRAIDSSARLGEAQVIRGALDAAWTMWTMHFLQPVEQSSGLLARLAAGRVFASRTLMPGMPVVPVECAGPLRADESPDLGAAYESWVRMTVSSLDADATRAITGLARALAGRASILEAASAMRAPRHPTMLAHAFVARPRMTMQDAARAMDVSFRAAQAVMDKFLESGLVREDTGRRRDRVYVCEGVMFAELPQPQGERLPEPSVR